MTKETMEQLKDYYEQYLEDGFDYQDMQDVIALVFEIYEIELKKEGK